MSAGSSPLHAAAAAGQLAVVRDLLAAGADVHAFDVWGRTPLMVAVDKETAADKLAISKALLAAESDAAEINLHGFTPLHFAATRGNVTVCQLLLKAGADVDAADSQGSTALYLAAARGHADAAAELLSAGADANKARQDGFCPLHAAAAWGHPAVLQLLLRAGAVVDAVSPAGATPLLFAAQQGHLAVVDLLLLTGADPNVADNSGMRPLQFAVERQDITLLLRLLQADADCNALSTFGDSMLAVAAAYDSVAVVDTEALLAAGARSSTVNAFGHDTLEAAVVDLDSHSEPQLAMVVALLSYEHAAPSVAATRAALVSTMQTGLYDITARLLLHLHQAAQQEGVSQDDAVSPVYDAQSVQGMGSDERAHTSLAMLHAWTADTADAAAACAELAGQEQEVAAITHGARDLMVQTAASRAVAAAAE